MGRTVEREGKEMILKWERQWKEERGTRRQEDKLNPE